MSDFRVLKELGSLFVEIGGFSSKDIIYSIIFPKENTNEEIPVHWVDLVDSFRLQPTANFAADLDIHANTNSAGSDIHAREFCYGGDSCGADHAHNANTDNV